MITTSRFTLQPPDPETLRRARAEMSAKCEAAAAKHTPRTVRVRWTAKSSYAAFPAESVLYGPAPITRRRLYLYLLELGRIVCRGTNQEPELWAQHAMRSEGIPMPRKLVKERRIQAVRNMRLAG